MATETTIEINPLKYTTVMANVGLACGIIYAFKNKTGFLKGVGYSLIFSLVGSSIGYAVDRMKAK